MIDCHLHLQDPRFAGRHAEIIDTLRSLGVGRLVVNGTCPADWDAVETLARTYPEVLPSFGIHPWHTDTAGDGWLDDLEARLRRNPHSGVGEIGLDRWIRNHDLDRQKSLLRDQLALAHRLDRPVTLHCLRAWGSLLDELEAADLRRSPLLHSYGGPADMVDRFASLGAYFSISGYFFREDKAGKLAVFDRVPPERLLIETDAPDMALPGPLVSHRWPDDPSVNHPGNLAAVYRATAAHLGIGTEALAERTARNFAAWWGREIRP